MTRSSLCRLAAHLRGVVIALAALGWAGGAAAQTVVPERGVVGTGLRLRQLDGVKRVLLVGAHPDDEDTSLIAALARGWGAEVAYLSLSRGEGGQNLIGPELDEGLGLVRTGELMAARRLDGGGQFFGRTFDFGYSKSAEETYRYWPREEVLADVVWVIRKYRPQVVVSIFPPGQEAGHGQHQVSGIATHEAFEAAGDPERFTDQLSGPGAVEPWAPAKLYRSSRFDPGDATTGVEAGGVDPLLGRSHFQLAMESRSQHRSQDMGAPQPMGPRSSRLELARSRVAGGEGGIFAGVDTALVSLAGELPPDHRERVIEVLERYRGLVREAEAGLNPLGDGGAVPALARAVDVLEQASAAVDRSGEADRLRTELGRKLQVAREALLSASGIVVEARAEDDMAVPGEEVTVEVAAWNGGSLPMEGVEPVLDLPDGWTAEALEPASSDGDRSRRERFFSADRQSFRTGPGSVEPGSVVRWRYRVRIPEDAELSRPYFLERPRAGQMYRWPENRSLWGLPRNPPVAAARVSLRLDAPGTAERSGGSGGGVDLAVRRPVEYVGVDDARGEYRTPFFVVPALSVRSRPGIMAWPADAREERTVSVSLRSQARGGFRGSVRLEAPEGWSVAPSEVLLRFEGPGQERSVRFRVRPDDDIRSGRHVLRAVATSEDGARFAEGFQVVDYPHIRGDLLFEDAETEISVFPVRVDPSLRVGYIMGSGDAGAEALSQIGVDVELLDADRVREGAFDPYDVVVLGVRAYETRPDLVGANEQLLDWVREGGTLIVQYNRYEFSGAGFAPYPVGINRPHDRVTDETAPVTVLAPESPVFTDPNRITAADFEGWAQERGLYFLDEWDAAYTPLLEMSDPGEDPKRGSLLVTPLGEGLWVYSGLAFFRQFPEGVPGAYRLFANLVSLEADEWRAHHGVGDGGR